MKEKHKARLASFVIFERDGKMLLARRFNTGYADGFYQMPSGHVEEHEYPSEAAIREIKEEVGVDIEPVICNSCTRRTVSIPILPEIT